jgi:hypothetical protein
LSFTTVALEVVSNEPKLTILSHSGGSRGVIKVMFIGKNVQQPAIFSSPELKAQVSYSDRRLSVVRLSVRLSVCKILHF